jgi:hypothetical protein
MADAANYKIKIKEMALYLVKVQLSLAVRKGHMEALEKTSCEYPVSRRFATRFIDRSPG